MPAGPDEYARMQQEYYDQRARSETRARALVHPDYDYAASQAPGFIRFLLNQYYSVHAPYHSSGQLTDSLHTTKLLSRLWPASLRNAALRRYGYKVGKGMPDCLDFGCGVGRLMRPIALAGGRVDGADISEQMLQHARSDPLLASSKFFVTGGMDCGAAPSASYDIVYSAICMQHIASRTIRQRILGDMRRVLRDGGIVALQFHHYPELHSGEVPSPHVAWSADEYAATGTNSEADVWITPDSIPAVIADFRAHFSDVALHFCEFPEEAKLFRGAYGRHRFEHLIVTASAGLTRAEAIYGL